MNEQHNFNAIIDDALESLPLAPLPSGFVSRIMSRIEPAFEPEPFRLRQSDVLIAAAVTFLFAIGVLFVLSWAGVVNVGWISAEIPTIPWLTPTTTIALIAVPLELILAYALYEAFSDPTL